MASLELLDYPKYSVRTNLRRQFSGFCKESVGLSVVAHIQCKLGKSDQARGDASVESDLSPQHHRPSKVVFRLRKAPGPNVDEAKMTFYAREDQLVASLNCQLT